MGTNEQNQHFFMGPNEQNQHFAELRQKVCLYTHTVVLQIGLTSLDSQLECFVTNKWKKWSAKLESDRL